MFACMYATKILGDDGIGLNVDIHAWPSLYSYEPRSLDDEGMNLDLEIYI